MGWGWVEWGVVGWGAGWGWGGEVGYGGVRVGWGGGSNPKLPFLFCLRYVVTALFTPCCLKFPQTPDRTLGVLADA